MGASELGKLEVVRTLLESGADVNAQTNVSNQMRVIMIMIIIIIMLTTTMMMMMMMIKVENVIDNDDGR